MILDSTLFVPLGQLFENLLLKKKIYLEILRSKYIIEQFVIFERCDVKKLPCENTICF